MRPRRNAFRYQVCYLAVPLTQWARGTTKRFLSIDRPNLFSLRSRDFGDGSATPAAWIDGVLRAHDLREANGEIMLVTLPRFLGYAFNPVNFWFCFDTQKALRAVLCEVNNTFGERHCYLCFHEDHRPIVRDEQLAVRKVFHVSPFMETKGSYSFRFACEPQRISIGIDLIDETGVMLATSMHGSPRPLTVLGLLKIAFAYPLQTLMVVALIHYQAVKLFAKGVRHYRKPAPPAMRVSH